jgi:hypothetical protein
MTWCCPSAHGEGYLTPNGSSTAIASLDWFQNINLIIESICFCIFVKNTTLGSESPRILAKKDLFEILRLGNPVITCNPNTERHNNINKTACSSSKFPQCVTSFLSCHQHNFSIRSILSQDYRFIPLTKEIYYSATNTETSCDLLNYR